MEVKLEIDWDDRAGAWRIGAFDADKDEWVYLPGAHDTGHALYVGSCAAATATHGIARAEHDSKGMLWPVTEQDIEPAVRVAAEAAMAAMSPLTKAESTTLRSIEALGLAMTRSRAIKDRLRAKHLLDAAGKITPAGVWRARALKANP